MKKKTKKRRLGLPDDPDVPHLSSIAAELFEMRLRRKLEAMNIREAVSSLKGLIPLGRFYSLQEAAHCLEQRSVPLKEWKALRLKISATLRRAKAQAQKDQQ